jgi:response regulator RpfG family c-di-GMP phosphodiesterase
MRREEAMTGAVAAGESECCTTKRRVDAGAILLVDDEAFVRRGLRRILERAGHRVLEAATVASARQALDGGDVDVVVLDLGLPDENGLGLLKHVSVGRRTAVVVLTGSRNRLDMKSALSGGAMGYLLKSADPLAIEAQVEAALSQLRVQRDVRAAHESVACSLADMVLRWDTLPKDIALHLCSAWDLRHVETGAHVRRIGAYTEAMALALGLPSRGAAELGELAILPDVGKIAIPDAILSKPGRLTEAEFAIMKQHTVEGARMLGGIRHPFFERAAVIALRHHERWDGSGYPGGLHGDECVEDARIVSIVDVYDALGTPRCYKPAWEERRIVEYFRDSSGKQFQAGLVEALFDTLPRLRELARQFPDPQASSAVFPVAPQTAVAR